MIRSHELEFELDDESECEFEDELEYELLGAVARRHAGPRQRPKSLRDAIPDDPNYQKHIPIDDRLDAKRIVGFRRGVTKRTVGPVLGGPRSSGCSRRRHVPFDRRSGPCRPGPGCGRPGPRCDRHPDMTGTDRAVQRVRTLRPSEGAETTVALVGDRTTTRRRQGPR